MAGKPSICLYILESMAGKPYNLFIHIRVDARQALQSVYTY